jgi:hypothetical protein
MAVKGKTIDAILAEGEQIVRVWEANPTFTLGEITLPKLKEMLEDLRTSRKLTDETRTLLTRLINETNGKAKGITAVVTRALSGFRAQFGPNSSQYEQAGGTRSDERKKSKKNKNKDKE